MARRALIKQKVILDKEAIFPIEDLFFSQTDSKGHILFGNSIFVHISDYTFEELQGQPHNIIRHPSMPKAIFKLFWDTISNEKSIFAYVKNRSKTGKYYWVLALAFPYKEGYLSIRLKPSSTLFEAIPGLYNEMLEIEKKKNTEASSNYLQQTIVKLGFENYESFMVTAFIKEIESRNNSVQSNVSKRFLPIVRLLNQNFEHGLELYQAAQKLKKEFKALKYLSTNMIIGIGQYGKIGDAMAVTSKTFNKWGLDSQADLSAFLEKQELFKQQSATARLLFCQAFLQKEMAVFFKNSQEKNIEEYIKNLDQLALENNQLAINSIVTLSKIFLNFLSSVQTLSESLMAFKIMKINSKIESAHLPDGGRLIEATVENTTQFINSVEETGDVIKKKTLTINEFIKNIKKELTIFR